MLSNPSRIPGKNTHLPTLARQHTIHQLVPGSWDRENEFEQETIPTYSRPDQSIHIYFDIG